MPPFFHSCKVLSLNVACASNESLAFLASLFSFFLFFFLSLEFFPAETSEICLLVY